MTATKHKKHSEKKGSRTSAASLVVPRTVHHTNFWLAKISAQDIEKSWKDLLECAKDAKHRITLGASVNGTMPKGVCLEGATVCITRSGSVLIFTANITSKSNGEAIREEKLPKVCERHPKAVWHDSPVCPACKAESDFLKLTDEKKT
jgi:hypothetical protein